MNCTTQGCAGQYDEKRISQVFTRDDESFVVEGIPALVCDLCGDIVLRWEIVEGLLRTLQGRPEPHTFLPAYSFRKLVA